ARAPGPPARPAPPGHGHGRGAAGGRREGHDALHRRRGQRLRLRLRTELRRAEHGLTYRTGGRSYERPPARGGRRPSGAVRPRPRRGVGPRHERTKEQEVKRNKALTTGIGLLVAVTGAFGLTA